MGAGHVTPSVARSGDIVLPPIRRVPDLPIELSGLMPNRDHNNDLLLELEAMPYCPPGEHPIIGILAADPFLRVDQLAERLADKGYRNLVNLPNAAQYGSSFRSILNDLNVGPIRERQVLKRFADLGFAISVAVAHVDDVVPAFALEPSYLFIVPSFDLWNEGSFDSKGLLGFCRQVADLEERAGLEIPIVLFGGRLGLSAAQAHEAGADGVLLD